MQIDKDDAPLAGQATAHAIDEAMQQRQAKEKPRGHLGMSQIGGPCDRLLWLKFRWSLPDAPSPRLLRVFKTGSLLEMAMIDWLRAIPGVELHVVAPNTGKQISFTLFGGHFAGSLDGVILGVPDAPKTWHVWECKTANTKRFAELQKAGMRQWSPEYWAQAQCYMGAIGMDRALFTVINKDDSSIYTERVQYEPMAWDSLQVRALRLLESKQPPEWQWKTPDHWESKIHITDASRGVYFGKELPAPNCRNCQQAEPVLVGDGAYWRCNNHDRLISLEEQKAGCELHQYITGLVPLPSVGTDYYGGSKYRLSNGSEIINGIDEDGKGFNSMEFFHLSKTGFATDLADSAFVTNLRQQYGGRIVAAELLDEDVPF